MKPLRQLVRRTVVYFLWLIILAVIQTSSGSNLCWLGAKPDLLLILAILSGALFGPNDGIVMGLASGALRDSLAGRGLGLGMLLLLYAGFLSGRFFFQSERRNYLAIVGHLVVQTVLTQLGAAILTWLIPLIPGARSSLLQVLLPTFQKLPAQLLLNLLAAIPICVGLILFGPYGRRRDSDENDLLNRRGTGRSPSHI